MRNPYRALFWEQCRVAGVLAFWIFLICQLLFLIVFIQSESFVLVKHGSETNALALFVVLTYSLCLIFRFNHARHLVSGFEKRLCRLPLKTPTLIFFPFFVRLAFLLLFSAALSLAHYLLFGEWLALKGLIGCWEVFLIVQTVDWVCPSIRGLFWIPVIFFVSLMSLGLFEETHPGTYIVDSLLWWGDLWHLNHRDFRNVYSLEYILHMLTSLPTFLMLALSSCGLSFLGVYWLRRDEQYGVFEPWELGEKVGEMRGARRKRFVSQAEAMLWFEGKRHGWKLPAFSLFIGVFLYLCYFGLSGMAHDDRPLVSPGMFLYLAPFLSIAIASLFTGVFSSPCLKFGKGKGASFEHIRPAEINDLSLAKLLAPWRTIALLALPAAIISLAGLAAFQPVELQLLREAMACGEATWQEVIALSLIGPLILLLLSWILSFPESLALLFFTQMIWYILYAEIGEERKQGLDAVLPVFLDERLASMLYATLLFSVIFSLGAFALYRRLISLRQVVFLGLVWLALLAVLLPLSRSINEQPLFSVVTVAYSALILLPFFSVPVIIYRRCAH